MAHPIFADWNDLDGGGRIMDVGQGWIAAIRWKGLACSCSSTAAAHHRLGGALARQVLPWMSRSQPSGHATMNASPATIRAMTQKTIRSLTASPSGFRCVLIHPVLRDPGRVKFP